MGLDRADEDVASLAETRERECASSAGGQRENIFTDERVELPPRSHKLLEETAFLSRPEQRHRLTLPAPSLRHLGLVLLQRAGLAVYQVAADRCRLSGVRTDNLVHRHEAGYG